MSTAVVFGANGVSGLAMVKELSTRPSHQWRQIIALSRRPPVLEHEDPRVIFKSVDLLGDLMDLIRALQDAGAGKATHVFFYAYVAKEGEDELIEVNRRLFETAISAVEHTCHKLNVFQLQTGYKYYGTHLGGEKLAPYPWIEDSPRHTGQNFYYVQEDMLAERARKNGWKWIVTRPNFIVGVSKGNFMSLAVTIALYATARKALGEPLVFPGSTISYNQPNDHSVAHNNAAFQVFAALNEKAYDKAFNIYDGESVSFSDLWPKIAAYFDIPLASPPADEPNRPYKPRGEVLTLHRSSEWINQNRSKLPEISSKLGVNPEVWDYATWEFMDTNVSKLWPDLASMGRANDIGWDRSVDTFEEGYRTVFDELKRMGIIPN